LSGLPQTANTDISDSKKKGRDFEIFSSNKPTHNFMKYS